MRPSQAKTTPKEAKTFVYKAKNVTNKILTNEGKNKWYFPNTVLEKCCPQPWLHGRRLSACFLKGFGLLKRLERLIYRCVYKRIFKMGGRIRKRSILLRHLLIETIRYLSIQRTKLTSIFHMLFLYKCFFWRYTTTLGR